MIRQKILVSSCLLGMKVRYDGKDNKQEASIWDEWHKQGRLVAICPEMAGGLPTPRPPAEQNGNRVITNTGEDVAQAYQKGAELALALCQKHDIKIAVLKARSPSCGNKEIYDGSFSNKKILGQGVTAALLTQHGVRVFNESEVLEANDLIIQLEAMHFA